MFKMNILDFILFDLLKVASKQ